MTMNTVKADEKIIRLQQQIGFTIQQFTLTTPMTADDVIAVLGFCLGATIANSPKNASIRDRRQAALANMDHGINAFLAAPKSGLIIPN